MLVLNLLLSFPQWSTCADNIRTGVKLLNLVATTGVTREQIVPIEFPLFHSITVPDSNHGFSSHAIVLQVKFKSVGIVCASDFAEQLQVPIVLVSPSKSIEGCRFPRVNK